ncbi:lipid-binding SYLF domain-containing protein [Pedobacter psychrodurus]|uniref:lipid-binding SYLF domain-containing protein n=1 Tax=Pedobacter psychrodurus TaxID=2530456 RepID=UPI00292DFA81|nr:lipid-binding SYLF domain-containing protein [Pedobacter psychrodurus]
MNFIKTIKLKITACICLALLITSGAFAQDKEAKRIETATVALSDFGKMKESIPAELLAVTQGIIVVPKLINAGFVVGGKRGRGIAMIKKADGSWSNPVFVTITGGSFGLQIGVQSVELVLVFKHSTSLTDIKKSSFTLGGDLSVAAGPVGRSSSANTDYKLDAEVYSYSRSKGLFAGLSLNGASLDVDAAANKAFYGKEISANTIFSAENSTDAKVKELKASLTLMK